MESLRRAYICTVVERRCQYRHTEDVEGEGFETYWLRSST